MDGDNAVNFLLGKYNKVKQAMLVKIEVSTHSDAYVLFESLNNRGTPLTAIDLMKNLIMARAESNNLTMMTASTVGRCCSATYPMTMGYRNVFFVTIIMPSNIV